MTAHSILELTSKYDRGKPHTETDHAGDDTFSQSAFDYGLLDCWMLTKTSPEIMLITQALGYGNRHM
jgi:hypothetical protein